MVSCINLPHTNIDRVRCARSHSSNITKFRWGEPRSHSVVDRVQRDAESAMCVVKAKLGDVTASELTFYTGLEG